MGPISDRIGRKNAVMLALFVETISFLGMAGSNPTAKLVQQLIFSRTYSKE